MNTIESSLFHKWRLPRNSHGAALHPTVILLHGRGANEDDLLSLSDFLDERLFIVTVRAPNAFQYGGGYAWYDILDVGRPEPVMHEDSHRRIIQFTGDITKGYPVDPKKIFLLGFSMGAMMSYSVSLSHPELYAGVIANSGYIPEETNVEYHWDRLGSIGYFVAHGTYDPIVPVQFGRRAKELLEQAGVALTYKEYPMGHEISQESLGDIARWIGNKIDN